MNYRDVTFAFLLMLWSRVAIDIAWRTWHDPVLRKSRFYTTLVYLCALVWPVVALYFALELGIRYLLLKLETK